jgi:integrase
MKKATNQEIVPAGDSALSHQEVERISRYLGASSSENTRLAYRKAWQDFEGYCRTNRFGSLPAKPETIMAYLTWLADSGYKPSTIQVRLSAIAFVHARKYAGDPNYVNPAQSEMVSVVMSGIRRELRGSTARKDPITRAELSKMVDELPHDLHGIRDRAILLLGFAGALRRSEIVSLDLKHVRFTPKGMTVTLPYSKTDQAGEGMSKTMVRSKGRLCPVRALEMWIEEAGIERGPIFRAVDKWGHVRPTRLSDRAIALIVKQAAEMAGLSAFDFSGHSLRAGFVTQAADDGLQEWMIQKVTGHKSADVLRRYIRNDRKAQSDAIGRVLGDED